MRQTSNKTLLTGMSLYQNEIPAPDSMFKTTWRQVGQRNKAPHSFTKSLQELSPSQKFTALAAVFKNIFCLSCWKLYYYLPSLNLYSVIPSLICSISLPKPLEHSAHWINSNGSVKTHRRGTLCVHQVERGVLQLRCHSPLSICHCWGDDLLHIFPCYIPP